MNRWAATVVELIFCLGIGLGCTTAMALDKSIETDVLVLQITTLIKAGKASEALPHFAKLESMGVDLPESFDYHYIDALNTAGEVLRAYERSETYLKRYGKKGKYYSAVVRLFAELAPKKEAINAAEASRAKAADAAQAQYQKELAEYPVKKADYAGKYEALLAEQRSCEEKNKIQSVHCYDIYDNKMSSGRYDAADRQLKFCKEYYPEDGCKDFYDKEKEKLVIPKSPIRPVF